MPIGGYRIFDLKKNDVRSSFILPGAYDLIEETVIKPILITNFLLDGVEQRPVWASFRTGSTGFVSLFRITSDADGLHTILVKDDDTVSVTARSVNADAPGEDGPSASM